MHRELPMTTAEAAAYIGISWNTFNVRRHRGEAPPGHRLSTIYVYWPEELDAWLAEKKQRASAGVQ